MLVLVALIVKQIHWRDYQVVTANGRPEGRPGLLSCLTGFHLLPFLAAAVLQWLTITLTACRWRLLLLLQGIGFNLGSVIRLSFLGEFFNIFLPGSMGGDAVKAFYVMRHTGRKAATLVSHFANRFLGLLTLVAVSLIMLGGWHLAGMTATASLKQPAYGIIVVAAVIVVVLFLSLNDRLHHSPFLRRMLARLPFAPQLEILREALYRHRKMGYMLLPVMIFSLSIVISFILVVTCLGLSLNLHIPWQQYFLYLPLIVIMTAVPVTPGGVGVMEELFLYFFSTAGDPQKVLALALLYRFTLIFCSLPGGLIFLKAEKISRHDLTENLAAATTKLTPEEIEAD